MVLEVTKWFNRMLALALGLAILLAFVACQRVHHDVSTSFYYWQTEYHLGDGEKDALSRLGVGRMYVRFFDVDYSFAPDAAVVPVAEIRGLTPDSSVEIVPVVYITQRALANTNETHIKQLALAIWNKVKFMRDSTLIKELQLDCDWTESTKSKYFRILETIASAAPRLTLSSTVRLHQVKYATSCGVPPVARGTLMCYNADNPGRPETVNSVFDESTIAKYIDFAQDYPIPLDVALPIFSQAVLFRNSKAMYLIGNATRQSIDSSGIFGRTGPNTYSATTCGYFAGHYIYERDSLRLEQPAMEQLLRISKKISNKIKNKDITVTFFHLDERTIERVNNHEIETILDCYR